MPVRLRSLTKFVFPKKLPAKYGGGRMLVTGRSDMRVLKPGWGPSAFDLMLVTDHHIKPGMVVWDIGANLGILAVMAASKVRLAGGVYALEADPYYAHLISRSARRLSSAYQPVNVLCAAIADDYGVGEFGISSAGHARNRLLRGDDQAEGLEARKYVPMVTGDGLLDSWRAPDFIKMDVEGAELIALKGCDRLLRTVRPVFYIEVSPGNAEAVAALYRAYDYEIFHLTGDSGEEPRDICSFYTIARPAPKS
mgnify:CR=1 FL=1